MMMKKENGKLKRGVLNSIRRIALSCMALTAVFAISACGQKVSDEEKKELDELVVAVENYYEEKYTAKVAVKDYEYSNEDGLFGSNYDTDVAYFYMEDGATVRWMRDEDKFSDDAQAETIRTYIANELKDLYETDDYEAYCAEEVSINEKYFTELYVQGEDGDILGYIAEKEVVSIDCMESKPIYVTGNAEKLLEDIGTYFRGENSICIIQVEEGKLTSGLSYGDEGCIAQYDRYPGKKETYIQNYVEIGEGIYATVMEEGLILEEGDIKLVTVDKEEVMAEAEEKCRIKSILAQTDIVTLEFSDKVKNWYDEKGITRDWITVVVRVDDEFYKNDGKLYCIELGKYMKVFSMTDTQFEEAVYIKGTEQYYFVGALETE